MKIHIKHIANFKIPSPPQNKMVDFIQVDCFTSQFNYSRLLSGTFLDRHVPYLLYTLLKNILSTKHILTQMKMVERILTV